VVIASWESDVHPEFARPHTTPTSPCPNSRCQTWLARRRVRLRSSRCTGRMARPSPAGPSSYRCPDLAPQRGRKIAETRGQKTAEAFGPDRCGNAWPATDNRLHRPRKRLRVVLQATSVTR
jgi:hypothetical protein